MKQIQDISGKAIVVRIRYSFWEGHITDKNVTEEVKQHHHATQDIGRFRKRLIPKASLKGLRAADTALREFHESHTLPWDDNGGRLLPTIGWDDYMAGVNELGNKYEAEKEGLQNDWPAIRELAKTILTDGLFNEDEYPEDIRSRFGFTVEYQTVPVGGDLRANLGADTENIQSQIDAQVNDKLTEAFSALSNRLIDVIRSAKECLEQRDIIQKAAFVNIGKLCEMVPKLNLKGDPRLDELNQECKAFADISLAGIEEIRKSKKDRKAAANQADDILKKLEAYGG